MKLRAKLKIYLFKKLRLDRWGYEWSEYWGIIRNYERTMFYFIFKSINPATRIGVSHLKDYTVKTNLAKFVNNVKYLLDNMS